jgi:hypothetical protein
LSPYSIKLASKQGRKQLQNQHTVRLKTGICASTIAETADKPNAIVAVIGVPKNGFRKKPEIPIRCKT